MNTESEAGQILDQAGLIEANRLSIRILLFDKYRILGEALSSLIERQPGFTIVGQANEMAVALEMARREQPDILLLDLHMDDEPLLESLPELFAIAQKARGLILTGAHDPQVYYRAVRFGAMGVVFKQSEVSTLMKAIEKVSIGEAWLDRSVTTSLLSEIASDLRHKRPDAELAKQAALTRREGEVIKLVCEGMRNKQIAATLLISEATVTHHLTSIFNKLGTRDRSQLIVYAYRHGLADPNS